MTPVLYWLIFCGVGKLLMYTLRKFPPAIHLADKNEFTRDLFSCYFCLGVWVYTFLALFFRINILNYEYVPLLTELVTGCATSFLMHVFSAGWEETFGKYVINV